MESYIEVTWITGALVLLNSSTLAWALSGKPHAFFPLVLYSAVVPAFACFCFQRWEWLWMAILEGVFFYWLYRDAWRIWLLMIAHRLLLNLTCYVLFNGTFHLGIYFVPIDCLPWLFWLGLIISWLAVFLRWKVELSQQNFIYPLEIRTTHTVIRLKGYLDSGNLMIEEGCPVLFLDGKYQEYFDGEHIQWVVMHTMQGESTVRCFKVQARLGKEPYHDVLIHLNKRMSLPLGANALLNIHMMTQE